MFCEFIYFHVFFTYRKEKGKSEKVEKEKIKFFKTFQIQEKVF
jgi:hypothetical protein